MNVLYDHQAFTVKMYGGVARYFYELIRSYNQNHALTADVSLVFSNNDYINGKSFIPHHRYELLAESRMVNQAVSLLNRYNSIRHIRKGHFDVFHPTYYHKYFLNYLGQKPFVLTFHDATSERYAYKYPDVGDHLPALKKKLLLRANRIITVSEFSKQEIQRFFGISPEKIDVIYLGTSLGESEPLVGQSTDGLPAKEPFPYLLYVGKRSFYKNFDGFFRAIRPVLNRYPDIHLVCAGGGVFSRAEQMAFHGAKLTRRVHYRPITDVTLLRLYQQALAFVFPSFNEGFGIPVLEAFSGGCPVLLSGQSSLPEVGGSAALYFDPKNDESIASVVEQVILDDALRADLSRRGSDRLNLFSCEKTAAQTLRIYQSLM
ncbi:MAG: glycosyltransferase family 4 protein [Rudanella sp.]|nr:glycosyltransferase family 4 protein [Rudanella sp.]